MIGSQIKKFDNIGDRQSCAFNSASEARDAHRYRTQNSAAHDKYLASIHPQEPSVNPDRSSAGGDLEFSGSGGSPVKQVRQMKGDQNSEKPEIKVNFQNLNRKKSPAKGKRKLKQIESISDMARVSEANEMRLKYIKGVPLVKTRYFQYYKRSQ
jgi:hypothetical protein